jgi:hypothetical protein
METFSVRFFLTRTYEGTVEVEAESKAAARLALGDDVKIDESILSSNDKGQLEVVSVVRLATANGAA